MTPAPTKPRLGDALLRRITEGRRAHRVPGGLRKATVAFEEATLSLLFPQLARGDDRAEEATVLREAEAVAGHLDGLLSLLRDAGLSTPESAQAVTAFFDALPGIHALVHSDAEALLQGDPAATSLDEIVLAYPGLHAIATYRLAHQLHLQGLPLLPRLLTEHAHACTGVDIHPGARIDRGFFIDHGTGVVIGETTVIGRGVKLYQGVTLGALVVEKDCARAKRHPTLEDNVVVYANATILGGETVIGNETVVSGNAWITRSVPPFSFVSHDGSVRPRRTNDAGGDTDFQI